MTDEFKSKEVVEYIRKGCQYPEGVFEVVREINHEDGSVMVELAPSGGGWAGQIDKARLEEQFDLVTDEMRSANEYSKQQFTGDWMGEGVVYEGYTQGYLWNGWQAPVFERPVIEAMIQNGDLDHHRFNADGTIDYQVDEEGSYTIEPYEIEFDGQTKTVYGAGECWCWEKAGEDYEN